MNKYPFHEVNQINTAEVVQRLNVSKARIKNKFACPACGGSDPLHVYADNGANSGRGAFCFSCEEPFTNVDLAMIMLDMSNTDACMYLAEMFGIEHHGKEVPRIRLKPRAPQRPTQPTAPKPADELTRTEILQHIYAQTDLTNEGARYLSGRGIDPGCAQWAHVTSIDTKSQWQTLLAPLGFGRVVCAGLGGLDRQTRRKWLLVNDAPFLLLPFWRGEELEGFRIAPFGQYRARAKSKYISPLGPRYSEPFLSWAATDANKIGAPLYIVEGELNALSLLMLGHRAIATTGTWGFQPHWIKGWLNVSRIVVISDGDKPGQAWAQRIEDAIVLHMGLIWARDHLDVLVCPDGEDVNDLLQQGNLPRFLEG